MRQCRGVVNTDNARFFRVAVGLYYRLTESSRCINWHSTWQRDPERLQCASRSTAACLHAWPGALSCLRLLHGEAYTPGYVQQAVTANDWLPCPLLYVHTLYYWPEYNSREPSGGNTYVRIDQAVAGWGPWGATISRHAGWWLVDFLVLWAREERADAGGTQITLSNCKWH